MYRVVLFALLGVMSVGAQPRGLEIFANAGSVRAGGDEGSLGSAAAWGGAVVVPLASRWAVDVDVQVANTHREAGAIDRFDLRRWLISPSIVYRRGSERAYWFVGGGPGAQVSRSTSLSSGFLPGLGPSGPGWRQVSPGVFEFRSGYEGARTLHARTGFVWNPVSKLLIRADLYSSWRWVLPDAGVKIGIGWRAWGGKPAN